MSGMDFFGRQRAARNRTTLLVVLFAAAVVAIVVALYFVVMFGLGAVGSDRPGGSAWWNGEILLWTTGMTLALVGLATLFRISQLGTGGPAVAQMLGGRLVPRGSQDATERKLLNVVEEVAIASGVPVPAVYVLDGEAGINAFAAGYRPNDAVIGVTQACMTELTRDELQGVVAHEFSHVLNGDMRLNIRLIGVLFGITCIAVGGRIMLRAAASSRGGKDKNGAPLVVLGLGMMLIGWLGTLFASLIRAAVSRQREFLADASAVQFTRNPEGIGNALRKIGAKAEHGALQTAQAAECSHMFFADAIVHRVTSLWATHPPLEQRIAAIFGSETKARLAAAVGAAPASRRTPVGTGDAAKPARPPVGGGAIPGLPGMPLPGMPRVGGLDPIAVVAAAGTLNAASLEFATDVLRRLPLPVATAVRSSLGAQAVVLAMLLDADAALRRTQLAAVATTDAALHHEIVVVAPMVQDLAPSDRLPVLDLAIPGLREMSKEQFVRFEALAKNAIAADRRVTPFEFALHAVLRHELAIRYRDRAPAPERRRLANLVPAVATVLSMLATIGTKDANARASAYAVGRAKLGDLALPPIDATAAARIHDVEKALDELAALAPEDKRTLLGAYGATIAADGTFEVAEVELLRAIAATLDVPLPPLTSPTGDADPSL